MFLTKEFLSLQIGSSLRKKNPRSCRMEKRQNSVTCRAREVSVLLLRERLGEAPWSDPCAGRDTRAVGLQL